MARNGKPFGQVTHVLFHPTEPRAVGLELQPPAVAMVVTRPPQYVSLEQVEIGKGTIVMKAAGKTVRSSAGTDFTWDHTVIWTGMPVVTVAGKDAGLVDNVTFDGATGAVKSMKLTGGLAADAAIGTRTVPGDAIRGFNNDNAIVIENVLRVADFSGGAAKKAGETAAVVKVKAGQLAEKATEAGIAGAIAAANSTTGKRARRAVKGWLAAAKDAMRVDDEDE